MQWPSEWSTGFGYFTLFHQLRWTGWPACMETRIRDSTEICAASSWSGAAQKQLPLLLDFTICEIGGGRDATHSKPASSALRSRHLRAVQRLLNTPPLSDSHLLQESDYLFYLNGNLFRRLSTNTNSEFRSKPLYDTRWCFLMQNNSQKNTSLPIAKSGAEISISYKKYQHPFKYLLQW